MYFSPICSSAPLLLSLFHLTTSTPVAPRQFSTSANDLKSGDCAPVTVIFARGTTEPGNIGTIVGPPLERAMQAALGNGNVAFQGVDYPANVAGFLGGGDPNGAKTMAALAQQAVTDCANTQLVMSGYRYVHLSLLADNKHSSSLLLTPLISTTTQAYLSFHAAKAHKSSPSRPPNFPRV